MWPSKHMYQASLVYEWIWIMPFFVDVVSGKIINVATPLWPSVGVKPNTSKVGVLGSSGTPECLEFDIKAQNTSHWSVLGGIAKVLQRIYLKWPWIGNLKFCSPIYGKKKGRESNCQFDSRPLKVGNQPLPDFRIEIAIRRWKDLDKGYSLVQTSLRLDFSIGSYELPKPRDSTQDSFETISGLQLGSPGKNSHLDVASVERYREYYMGEGGGFPDSGPWCVLWSKVPVACPNTQGCPGMWTNHLGGLFWCRFKLDLLNLFLV
jgi:hypothetical protein